jgi:hypothetical protein
MRLPMLLPVLLVAACGGPSESGDPCSGVTCSFHGFCVTDGISPYCACDSGFHPVGLACAANNPDDPCDGVDCSSHGACRVDAGFPVCDCDPGYAPDPSRLHCLPSGDPPADAGTDDADADDADAEAEAGLPTAFFDDFSGDLSAWVTFGSPEPIIRASIRGRGGVLDNRGDPEFDSGIITRELLACTGGCRIETEFYLDWFNPEGCWAAMDFGLSLDPHPDGAGYSDETGGRRGVQFAVLGVGNGCWGTPAEYRPHVYLAARVMTAEGTLDTHGEYALLADDYADGWHVFAIEITGDRLVRFRVDGDLVWASTERLAPEIVAGRNLIIQGRSSGSAGRAYNDWIRLEGW